MTVEPLGPSPVFDTGTRMNALPPEHEARPAKGRKALLVSLVVACALLLTGTATMTVMLVSARQRAELNGTMLEASRRSLKSAETRIQQARAEAADAVAELNRLRSQQSRINQCEIAALVVKEAMARPDNKYFLEAALKQLDQRCQK
ncbi:hypothetical protein N8J89_39185 [Crossiella sp. CA-258035]|uniref:hypothetical protein n=1 Tax=Crossiella sp. CA-258035 TaxID=2981138 RepID=UPI0024BCB5F9|nr:hypothetical protein [Crossiella sp. CA-258035]WHT19051.1 hypothetical protein N8J89_39185 [Crossiella sp. CA-258035]